EIAVVVTRHRGYRKKEESFWVKSLYESYYRDHRYRFLVEAMGSRFLLYNRALDDLERRHRGIDVIYPPDDFRVDRLTRDGKRIMEGFAQGAIAGREYLRSLRG
ncbi:MAG TPA: hypothetical protein PL135_14725, partial [Spirochaetota bacterium]|nr:hypothetical protein [Spirochaetota bacterium]